MPLCTVKQATCLAIAFVASFPSLANQREACEGYQDGYKSAYPDKSTLTLECPLIHQRFTLNNTAYSWYESGYIEGLKQGFADKPRK